MSKFIFLTKIKRKFKKSSKSLIFNIKILNIIIFSLICLVGILHIIKISNAATGGFKIKEIEQRIEQAKQMNEKLELQVAELQSLKTIQEKIKSLNFELVSVAQVEFLSPSNLAVKK